MKTKLTTIRISIEARRLLKLITALVPERFYYEVLERVLREELARLAPALVRREEEERDEAEREVETWEKRGA